MNPTITDATVKRCHYDIHNQLRTHLTDFMALADPYGRHGYCWIAGLLQGAGWRAGHKRVERIRRREGLKVP